jgi:acyl dehydratase
MSIYTLGERFTREVTFDREMARSLATALGDTNPLHHDDAFAEASRFGGPIVSGAVYGALLMSLMAQSLAGRADGVGLDFSVKFVKAVPEGAVARLEWEVVAITPKPGIGGEIVEMDGRLVLLGGREEVVATTARGRSLVMPRGAMVAARE